MIASAIMRDTILRVTLGMVGCLVAAYGVRLALGLSLVDQAALLLWLATGVVLHDGLLAPLVVLLGWWTARRVPAPERRPVTIAAIVLGTVTLAAVPVLLGFGGQPSNPTILDRNYVAGWLVLAVLVALVATASALVRRAQVRGR